MSAAQLTAALGGRWCSGGRYGICSCPSHVDTNPSLTIRDGDKTSLRMLETALGLIQQYHDQR